MNEELIFCENSKKKFLREGLGGQWEGSGWGGEGWM